MSGRDALLPHLRQPLAGDLNVDSGEKWYIGAITDWTARTLEAPLKFLGGGRYRMTVFADGVNADRIARDYRTETREVTRDDTVALRMAPGGGWAAVLEPVK